MNAVSRSSLIGAGIGAGLMYLLDPNGGARRRALVRHKIVWTSRKTRDAAGTTRRDLGNRLSGLAAEARGLFSDEHVENPVLVERSRAELGRVASHPRAITVTARNGIVTLAGDVLADEVSSIVSHVKRVRGVRDVRNEMTAYPRADGVPSLQGEADRPSWWSTWLTNGWSLTAMLAAVAAAAATTIAIAVRRR